MNYAKCATCHGLNSMGFCQYTACRYPATESGVINGSVYVAKVVTNADRIRSMTDEELAHLLHSAEEHLFTGNLWNYEKWTEWLKQEAKNEL